MALTTTADQTDQESLKELANGISAEISSNDSKDGHVSNFSESSREERDECEESEDIDISEESSDVDSVASESEIGPISQRISQLESRVDLDESSDALSRLMQYHYRILSFFVKKHGETSPYLAKYFLNYAEAFFNYLRWNCENGENDESEDASVGDDWDVVIECLRRAISGAEKLLKLPTEEDSPSAALRKSLDTLVWIYVYREDKLSALQTAETLVKKFPCTSTSLLLAEMQILSEHYASAKSIISTLQNQNSQPGFTEKENEKMEDLRELLFDSDASSIKWKVSKYVKDEYSVHSKKGSDGSVVTAFSSSNQPTKNDLPVGVGNKTLTIRRKRTETVVDMPESSKLLKSNTSSPMPR